MDLGPLNIFSFPANTMWTLISRRCREGTAGRRLFVFVCHLGSGVLASQAAGWLLWYQAPASSPTSPLSRCSAQQHQWSAASCSTHSLGRFCSCMPSMRHLNEQLSPAHFTGVDPEQLRCHSVSIAVPSSTKSRFQPGDLRLEHPNRVEGCFLVLHLSRRSSGCSLFCYSHIL